MLLSKFHSPENDSGEVSRKITWKKERVGGPELPYFPFETSTLVLHHLEITLKKNYSLGKGNSRVTLWKILQVLSAMWCCQRLTWVDRADLYFVRMFSRWQSNTKHKNWFILKLKLNDIKTTMSKKLLQYSNCFYLKTWNWIWKFPCDSKESVLLMKYQMLLSYRYVYFY